MSDRGEAPEKRESRRLGRRSARAPGRRSGHHWRVLALPAFLALPWIVTAQSMQPPFDLKDAAIIAGGRILFNQRCAGRCHGLDGREGFDGPILVGKDYLDRSYVWAALVTGRPGTAMPAWEGRLTDDELWKIIAFVSSLGDQARAPR